MEIDYTENSNWILDYGLVEDLSTVSGTDFPAPVPDTIGFGWPSEALNCSSNVRCVSFSAVFLFSPLFGCRENLNEKIRKPKLNFADLVIWFACV